MCNYREKITIKTFFSGETDLALRVVNLINTAQYSIEVMMFSFSEDRVINALVQSVNRGVSVRVVVDLSQLNGKSMKREIEKLYIAKIPVKVSPNPRNYMHIKTVVIDGRVNTTGSLNSTRHGNNSNWERLDIIYDRDSSMTARNYFNTLWNNTTFTDYTPIIQNLGEEWGLTSF